jgi:hypothetical protein
MTSRRRCRAGLARSRQAANLAGWRLLHPAERPRPSNRACLAASVFLPAPANWPRDPSKRPTLSQGGGKSNPPRAAQLTGFEDSNSSENVGIDSKATGQGMNQSNIGENLALLNNGSNGDSVPATVPGSEPVWLRRQRLNLGPHPYQLNAGNRCANRPFRRAPATVEAKVMRSIGAQVCVRRDARFLPLASTRAQPTVVSHPAHGHCTLAVAKRHKRGRSNWC